MKERINTINMGEVMCQTAILNQSCCLDCKRHKRCEMYGSYLVFEKNKEDGRKTIKRTKKTIQ
jgi:hypothetical protein